MIMGCRVADRAGVMIGNGDLTVACTVGIVGADTITINRTSTITGARRARDRWAHVVARRLGSSATRPPSEHPIASSE
jgi:hypothetical protein